MLNVIKEYMVSLGYHVDMSSYNQAQQVMKETDSTVSKFADSAIAKFAATGVAVVTFVNTATGAIAKFTADVAKTDLQNQIFARQMWMNVDSAVAYKKSLEALGVTLQDLYLSPELMERFLSLRNEAKQLVPPGDFEGVMKSVRDVSFEFQKLKLEASYGLQWIAYYLVKDLAGPMGDFKKWISDLNTSIVKNLPVWTKYIADFLASIVRLGNAFNLIGPQFIKIWDTLGKSTKEVLAMMAGAGAAILILSNPIATLAAAMVLVLALIDDYYSYSRGEGNAFPELWKWFDKVKKEIVDSGIITKLSDDLESLAITIERIGKQFFGMFTTPGEDVGTGALRFIDDMVTGLTRLLNAFVRNSIIAGQFFQLIAAGAKGDYVGVWRTADDIKNNYEKWAKDDQADIDRANSKKSERRSKTQTLEEKGYTIGPAPLEQRLNAGPLQAGSNVASTGLGLIEGAFPVLKKVEDANNLYQGLKTTGKLIPNQPSSEQVVKSNTGTWWEIKLLEVMQALDSTLKILVPKDKAFEEGNPPPPSQISTITNNTIQVPSEYKPTQGVDPNFPPPPKDSGSLDYLDWYLKHRGEIEKGLDIQPVNPPSTTPVPAGPPSTAPARPGFERDNPSVWDNFWSVFNWGLKDVATNPTPTPTSTPTPISPSTQEDTPWWEKIIPGIINGAAEKFKDLTGSSTMTPGVSGLSAFTPNIGAFTGNNQSTIELAPVYHIYESVSPNETAKVIQQNNTGLLIRAQQGVIV